MAKTKKTVGSARPPIVTKEQETKIGRPDELTQERIKTIAAYIQDGNYIETACALEGISKKTLYNWLKKGREEPGTIHEEFLHAMEKAAAWSEARDVRTITAASAKNWTAAAWRLERKYYDRWGKRDTVIHGGGLSVGTFDMNETEKAEFKTNFGALFPDLMEKLEDDAGDS
jgi:transposase